MGFHEIYNLDGGILAWINSDRTITASASKHPQKGMTIGSLTAMTKQKKYVIVDYNAKWCGYCGKMLPYLQSLASAKKDTVLLISVDADANKGLLKQKKISGFPYLELYKNGHLIWHNQGYLDEKAFLQSTKL
jgi:thioredoxin 1